MSEANPNTNTLFEEVHLCSGFVFVGENMRLILPAFTIANLLLRTCSANR